MFLVLWQNIGDVGLKLQEFMFFFKELDCINNELELQFNLRGDKEILV